MMSLLTRRIFNRIRLRNLMLCSESNLMQTQYYTCLSGSGPLQMQKFGNRQRSSVEVVRELHLTIGKENSLVSRVVDVFWKSTGINKQKYIAKLWYASLDEINIDEFFTILKLPDTYYNWFKVIELHVWMLLFQLHQDKNTFRYIREGVVEAMWIDVEQRAKLVDEYNLNYNKNIKQFYERFKQSLFWYDHGYLEDDIVLANIVWAVLFDRENDDPELLEAVVRYIRFQMKHLESIDMKSLDENKKTGVWTPLRPHCKRFLT